MLAHQRDTKAQRDAVMPHLIGKLPVALSPLELFLHCLAWLHALLDGFSQPYPVVPVEPHIVEGMSGREILTLIERVLPPGTRL